MLVHRLLLAFRLFLYFPHLVKFFLHFCILLLEHPVPFDNWVHDVDLDIVRQLLVGFVDYFFIDGLFHQLVLFYGVLNNLPKDYFFVFCKLELPKVEICNREFGKDFF